MSWRTENQFDEESIRILEIAEHFLVTYFDHSKSTATELVTNYFHRFNIPEVEQFISHELSWNMAKRIHFTMALHGDRGSQIIWEVENGLRGTPREALEYLRENYWRIYWPE